MRRSETKWTFRIEPSNSWRVPRRLAGMLLPACQILLGLACPLLVRAQEGNATDSSSSTSSTNSSSGTSSPSPAPSAGASSAFGSVPASALPSDSAAPTPSSPAVYTPPAGAGSSPTGFGTGIGTGTAVGSGQAPGTEIPGGVGAARAEQSPTSFSISTGYGRAPEVFVSGEGRLARPKFQTTISGSIGFDDNIFQTPTNARGTPDVVVEQQVTEGTAAQVVLIPIANTQPTRIGPIGPAPRQLYREVVIPAVEPQFEKIVIPGTPAPKRQVSAISRESLGFEAQTATRRTVFTLDFNVNSDYYWNRPTKKEEYSGSLAVRYLHRFTPRLQMTASLDAAYLAQPDLTQINLPTTVGNGNYLTINSKVDLSYRWSPRFSTVTSLNYNQLSYDQSQRQGGDYRTYTIGTEFRYLWSPRITAVVEGRYSKTTYPNLSALDSSAYFALVGFDASISRRAGATLRVGESVRSFDEEGGSSAAPYLEATLNYQLGRSSVLSWNNRFGFEEPPGPNSELLGLRSNVAVTHFFGPRLRGSLGVDAIYQRTTDNNANTSTNQTTLDSSLSLLYTLTRSWTFNMNYSYTTVFLDQSDGDYFRNRVFAGFDYSF